MEHFIEDDTPLKPTWWESVKAWFLKSETIFWARLNVLVGGISTIITLVDPNLVAAVIDPRWVPAFFLVNGIATEVLRRRRAPNLGEPK